MSSWVYLFSRFTPEALFIEGVVILTVVVGYSAFWVLKKRKYGVVDTSLPAIPVRTYLDGLIQHAEQLRHQLFGISYEKKDFPLEAPLNDNELGAKIKQLEVRLSDKERGFESLTIENTRLTETLEKAESQLNDLKNKVVSGANEDKERMEEQLRTLEEKLAEYSIIEDDLANLKRFQNENIKLKAVLSEKGIAIPTTTAAAETKAAADPAPSAEAETPSSIEPTSDIAEEGATEPESDPSAEPLAEAENQDELSSVESLISASLKPNPVPGPTASATPAGSDKAPPKEEDLVKEFEMMLKN